MAHIFFFRFPDFFSPAMLTMHHVTKLDSMIWTCLTGVLSWVSVKQVNLQRSLLHTHTLLQWIRTTVQSNMNTSEQVEAG